MPSSASHPDGVGNRVAISVEGNSFQVAHRSRYANLRSIPWVSCGSLQSICRWVLLIQVIAWIFTETYLMRQRRASRVSEGGVVPQQERGLGSSAQSLDEVSHVPIRLDGASLDQLRVSSHATMMQKAMRDIVLSAVVYGAWKVRHPRFIRTSHAIWWHAAAVTRLPFGGSCNQEYHTLIQSIPAADMHHILGADLRASEKIARILNFDEDPVPSHEGWLVVCMADNGMMEGQSAILYNATIAVPQQHECAQGARFDALRVAGAMAAASNPTEKHASMFYAAIPGAASTLHGWVHHLLHKITQGSLMEERSTSWTPLHTAEDAILPMITQLYEHVGWNAPVISTGQAFTVDALMYACRTPPVHPLLWQRAQKHVLGIEFRPVVHRQNIVFCMDTDGSAAQLAGENRLLSFLTKWSRSLDSQFSVIDYRNLHFDNFAEELAFWADTRALIGAHNNCLAHSMFIPSNALVVELLPVAARGLVSAEMSMNYLLAMSLEHEYWMLPSHIDEESGLFEVDLVSLCDLLVSSLGIPAGERLSLCFGSLEYQDDYKNFLG